MLSLDGSTLYSNIVKQIYFSYHDYCSWTRCFLYRVQPVYPPEKLPVSSPLFTLPLVKSLHFFTLLSAVLTTVHADDMPTKKNPSRKHGPEVPKPVKGTNSHILPEHRAHKLDTLSGLEDLDEDTLLSLSLDTPTRLTPSPDVMQATLDRLGFGPPNDLTSLPVSPTPTPTNSITSSAGKSGLDEKITTAEEPVPTSVESSDADDIDAYGQISGMFHQIAQRTGQSVNVVILEWALLHAAKRQVAHDHRSTAMTARQQTFEEEADKVIELVGQFFWLGFLGY